MAFPATGRPLSAPGQVSSAGGSDLSNAIAGLTPESLWQHFARIAANPPSKNQEKIAAHIVEIATADQLDVMRGRRTRQIATAQKFWVLLTGVLRTLS